MHSYRGPSNVKDYFKNSTHKLDEDLVIKIVKGKMKNVNWTYIGQVNNNNEPHGIGRKVYISTIK
jgi:hypothetical protein